MPAIRQIENLRYDLEFVVMLNIPVLRWGRPYTSLEVDNVIHFATGETLAKVSQANPGLLAKDIRQAQRARDVLCEIPCRDLIRMSPANWERAIAQAPSTRRAILRVGRSSFAATKWCPARYR